MANPLFISQFFNTLDFLEVSFALKRYEVGQILKGGQSFGARMGKPRWMISGVLRSEKLSDQVQLEARFGLLEGMAGSFFAFDPRKPYPINDPTGSIFTAGGASCQISAINSTGDGVKFSGLPSNYNIQFGDYFSIATGTMTYLFRSQTSVTATGTSTATFAIVEPLLMTGIAVGNAVNFVKPQGIFKLPPSGIKFPSSAGNRSDGISFEALQVL